MHVSDLKSRTGDLAAASARFCSRREFSQFEDLGCRSYPHLHCAFPEEQHGDARNGASLGSRLHRTIVRKIRYDSTDNGCLSDDQYRLHCSRAASKLNYRRPPLCKPCFDAALVASFWRMICGPRSECDAREETGDLRRAASITLDLHRPTARSPGYKSDESRLPWNPYRRLSV